jgi:hypothetical protein
MIGGLPVFFRISNRIIGIVPFCNCQEERCCEQDSGTEEIEAPGNGVIGKGKVNHL